MCIYIICIRVCVYISLSLSIYIYIYIYMSRAPAWGHRHVRALRTPLYNMHCNAMRCDAIQYYTIAITIM